MPGFEERLGKMRAAQEAADAQKRAETERQAAEAAREARLGELAGKSEAVGAELAQTEQDATAATEAVAQAETFAAEQGESLDPQARAEIDAIKSEAAAATGRLEALRTELATIDAEMAALEGGGGVAEQPTGPTVEGGTVEAEAAPAAVEVTGATAEASATTEAPTASAEATEPEFEQGANELARDLSGSGLIEQVRDGGLRTGLQRAIELVGKDPDTWGHELSRFTMGPSVESYMDSSGVRAKEGIEKIIGFGRIPDLVKAVKANDQRSLDSVLASATSAESERQRETQEPDELKTLKKYQEDIRRLYPPRGMVDKYGRTFEDLVRDADLAASDQPWSSDAQIKGAVLLERTRRFKLFVKMEPAQYDQKYKTHKETSIVSALQKGPVTEVYVPDAAGTGYRTVGEGPMKEAWQTRSREIDERARQKITTEVTREAEDYMGAQERAQRSSDFQNDLSVVERARSQFGERIQHITTQHEQRRQERMRREAGPGAAE